MAAKYTIRRDKTGTRANRMTDGRLALGVFIGALGPLFAYLCYASIFGTVSSEELLRTLPIIISVLAAAATAYFAASALLEQRQTREASTDPVLIAHLGQRRDARELVTFNISNIGAGAALNVHLQVHKPTANDENLSARNIIMNIFGAHHPFSIIQQNHSIEFNFALGWHLLGSADSEKDLGPLPPFRVDLTYEDLAGGKYESEFTIDIREMAKLGANKSPEMRMVSALEQIAKNTK